MRARYPDIAATVERDGATIGYEVFGEGEPTVLLLPTWTIIHSRFWKMQVPYLARRYRVITFDGPGNGRSDRITDPARYSADAYAADAAAVLDACGAEQAVVVGLSRGAGYGLRLASLHAHRVAGLVLVGPALPLVPLTAERAGIGDRFDKPYPDSPQGWDKYNAAYWRDHYDDFAAFFFGQVFSEPHSTKPHEDAVGWSRGAGPDVLIAEANRSASGLDWQAMLSGLGCPLLVVHGADDHVQSHGIGVEAARLGSGSLVSMEGSGHMPNVRDPVRFNLVLREFLERVAA